MMLEYGPIPDVSNLKRGERAALSRRLHEIDLMLSRIGDDHKSYRLRQEGLHAFIEAAHGMGDYGAMRLALDLWERLPAEVRESIARRCEELHEPHEIAAKQSDQELRWHIEHPWKPTLLEPNATAKERRAWARLEARRLAMRKAYRNEYRRRMNPHLSLVWVNEHPSTPLRSARFAETLARSRNQMSDILDRLNEGRPGDDAG